MKPRSLRPFFRMIILYIGVISLAITFLLLFYYREFFSKNSQMSTENLRQVGRSIAEQIDIRLQHMDSIALQAVTNTIIVDQLKEARQDPSEQNHFVLDTTARDAIQLQLTGVSITSASRITVARISVFNDHGDFTDFCTTPELLDRQETFFSSDDFQSVYSSFQNRKAFQIILPDIPDMWSESGWRMVSVFRPFRNFETDVLYGLVEVQQPVSFLTDILSEADPNLAWLLLDENGRIVFSNQTEENDRLSQEMLALFREGALSDDSVDRQGDALFSMHTLTGGMVLLGSTEVRIYQAVPLLFGAFAITMSILFWFIAYYLSSRMQKEVLQPLHQMQMELSSLDVHAIDLPLDTDMPALVDLRNAFMSTLRRLETAAREIETMKTREVKAQMLALQNQMNSHFVHNTLAVIASVGCENDGERLSNMCRSLSGMLQYTSTLSPDGATLREELQHLENYFYLMQQRYEGAFEYTIEIKNISDLSLIRTPKMILQPLAENAFQHAFAKIRPPFRIKVTLDSCDDFWTFSITDNGCGIAAETIAEIESKIAAYESNPTQELEHFRIGGLGLLSTIIRMRQFYPQKSTHTICAGEKGGTTICVGGQLHV